jgi:hypothetical protein
MDGGREVPGQQRPDPVLAADAGALAMVVQVSDGRVDPSSSLLGWW